MNRSERYSKINSLKKLRKEREMLENEITKQELMMQAQYSDFMESISITRFLTSLISKITMLYPVIDWIKRIYGYFAAKHANDTTLSSN